MRIILILLVLFLAASGISWYLYPKSTVFKVEKRSDMPWQVETFLDGTSMVFDIHLGKATLQDTVDKFGRFSEVVLFEDTKGQYSLEAYFPKAMIGPLEAKIITTLDMADLDAKELLSATKEREATASGAWKWTLSPEAAEGQLLRRLQSLTYIPSYAGLDVTFFRERFGKPRSQLRIDEDTVQWFYPGKGVSLIINSNGKDVFEYSPPKAFKIPKGTSVFQQ